MPLDDSLQDSGSNVSPKGPDSEITGIAEALNKFSSQLEENNEVIAKKAKNSDEDKIQKHYNQLDPVIKLLVLNAGSKNGTASLSEPPYTLVDLLSRKSGAMLYHGFTFSSRSTICTLCQEWQQPWPKAKY